MKLPICGKKRDSYLKEYEFSEDSIVHFRKRNLALSKLLPKNFREGTWELFAQNAVLQCLS